MSASTQGQAHGDADLPARIGRLIERHLQPSPTAVAITGLTQIFGGNARKAWAFELSYHSGSHAHRLPCVLLSQPGGRQVESDVAWEYEVLNGLEGRGTRVPRAIAVDVQGQTIGMPSIVLERLPGKANAVEFLEFPQDTGARIVHDLATVAAQLHRVEWRRAGERADAARLAPRDVAMQQVDYWCSTFEAIRLEPHAVMTSLFGWLRRHLPDPPRICLVHGDLRPGNFLYEHSRVSGLLDWELAHLGDPTEDLGWIYRPFWSPQRFVGLREFVARYQQLVDWQVPWSSVLYYRIFSELKFATISLTAAKAFASGSSSNLRHADRAATVAPCLHRCQEWIELHRAELAHA